MSEGLRRRKETKVVEKVVPESDENPQGAVRWVTEFTDEVTD